MDGQFDEVVIEKANYGICETVWSCCMLKHIFRISHSCQSEMAGCRGSVFWSRHDIGEEHRTREGGNSEKPPKV